MTSTGRHNLLSIVIIFSVLSLFLVSIKHISTHPFPSNWDEAEYLRVACSDQIILNSKGILAYIKQLVWERNVPPGYRLAALITFPLGIPNIKILRCLTLLSFISTAALLFLSGRMTVNWRAGVLWATVFCFSTGSFVASMHFGTETVLYPAIAGLIYAIARLFRNGQPDALTIAVLAFSTGVGALSKLSFFVIFVPMIGAAMLVIPPTNRRWQFWRAILFGIGCGILVSLPWWVENWAPAIAYARFASTFYRHDFPWISEAVTELFGIPLLLFITYVLIDKEIRRKIQGALTKKRYLALAFVYVCGAFPIIFLHALSANHSMRLITPALIPLFGIIILIIDMGALREKSFSVIIVAFLLAAQTIILAEQLGVVSWFGRYDTPDTQEEFDWDRLRRLTEAYQYSKPIIFALGSGGSYNPSAMAIPWACRGETVSAGWIWRYEDGPIDWHQIEAKIAKSDVVVTAPGLIGYYRDKQNLDNRHNDELARRLYSNPDVWKAVTLDIGYRNKREIAVFLRNE